MAIPKVMGVETEYGITVRNQPDFNPILSSLLLINSYETFRSSRIRWDYEAESPLRDARGFEYMEEKDVPSKEESRLINLILSNGARFYVDHAHPEYSSPETTNPRDLVIWDRAGERILNLSRQRAEAVSPPEQRILIYKNNTDYKGNSYGCHENYLMDRRVPFARIVQHLMPFFVTRQIFTGAGKVGAENNADPCDYQISQRADFLETEVGLETMHSRPIINTRDEPHADPEKYRRLHVIVGDSNMSEVATYLKVGTTALVLDMIEDGFFDKDYSLQSPVQAIRDISHDPTLKETVKLKDGRALSALELQLEYLEHATRYVQAVSPDPATKALLARWTDVLVKLEEDPMQLNRELDWVIKREWIESYMERHRLSWRDPRISLMDLQYHDIRPDRGLYYRLVARDLVDRITDDATIERAKHTPPQTTRARLRGEFIRQANLKGKDYRVDWVYLKLNDPERETILCKDPFQAYDERVARLIVVDAYPAPEMSPGSRAIAEAVAALAMCDGLGFDPAIARRIAEELASGEARRLDLWPFWEALRCPTLLVRGAWSDVLPAPLAAEMLARQPRARLATVPGVGHQIPFQRPRELAELIEDFLDDLQPGGGRFCAPHPQPLSRKRERGARRAG